MVGQTVANEALDRYEVLAPLGSGGFASVFLARHRMTGREVALKVTDPGGDPELVARALNEARVTASIPHPSLVPVFDCGALPDGRIFVAMERIDGVSLDALLEREGGRMAPRRAVALAVQALSALESVHAHGVVHRDIKPANLLVRADARGEHLYVIDFGVSKIPTLSVGGDQPATMMGAILGTPGYMAPEQLDARAVDARADVYGVAAVLYRALSGRKPYETRTLDAWIRAVGEAPPPLLASVAPWVQPALAQVIDRALARDRDARPASATAMREALSAVLALDAALSFGGGAPDARTLETPHTPRPAVSNVATPLAWAPTHLQTSTPTASPRPTPQPVVARSARAGALFIALGFVASIVITIAAWLLLRDAPEEKPTDDVAGPEPTLAPGATVAESAPEVAVAASPATAQPLQKPPTSAPRVAPDAVTTSPEPATTPAAPAEVAATPEPATDTARRARFVSVTPVGDVDMDEVHGFIRRALPGVSACYTGAAPMRVQVSLILNPTTAPLVTGRSETTDTARCAATALVSVIPRRGTRSSGILNDVLFVWQ